VSATAAPLAGRLESLAAELGEDAALPLVADVADSGQVGDAVAATLERFGRLDAVVNSAGVSIPASLADTDDDTWRAQIDANLSGSFFVARAAAPHMGEGGSIVNVGSELSDIGMEMFVAYCASKAWCSTAELELFGAEAALAETLARVPLGRLAQPDEVAAAILYLTADASYATGTAFALDGGATVI
jgi:NAD(P)-dependent dehydrogenase (short-subunit alcohol dehydrogenase family)